MKYYKVYGYNANFSELWRLSKKKPARFLMAIVLKFLKSETLVFEQPDASAFEYISYDVIENISPETIADLADIKREIELHNYSLALVQHAETDRNTGFNLVFVSPMGDRYIPLLWAKAKSKREPMKDIRHAIISFDSASNPIVTTTYPSIFDPMPSSVYTVLPGKSLAKLDDIHSGILRKLHRAPVGITTGNIKDMVAKMEDISYRNFRSRGIYSEKYERYTEASHVDS